MDRRYIPALGHDTLTRFYDPLLRRTLHEAGFKRRLLKQAGIRPGHRVLDLGCGTATLTLLIRQTHPQAQVTGVDGDPKVLRIAKDKAERAGVSLNLHRAMAFRLPYADGSFDRVLSTLLFHHLGPEEKRQTLREVWRVLGPAGELHIADWGKAEDWKMRMAFLIVQCIDGFKTTSENARGALPELLRQAGFADVREFERRRTVCGTLSLYQGKKQT